MIEFPRNSLIDALGRLVAMGFIVVRGASVPALVVMMPGGMRFAAGAFVLRAVDLLVAIIVAVEAAKD